MSQPPAYPPPPEFPPPEPYPPAPSYEPPTTQYPSPPGTYPPPAGTYPPPPPPPAYPAPAQPGAYPPPAPSYEPPTNPYLAPPAAGWQQVPVRNESLNGFAVAALILGLCGGLLGLVFGIIALVQIKRDGGRGRGMAIAGVVLSCLWLLVIVAIAAVAIATGGTQRDPVSGQVTGATSVALEDLVAGDCVKEVTEDELRFALQVVPCTEPHRAEVTGVEALTGSTYPGDDVIDEDASEICSDLLESYAPSALDDPTLDLFYFPPNERTWSDGDRKVICLVSTSGAELTSSVAG